MNLLLLPGGSMDNKAWINGFIDAFGSHFENIYVHQYAHWVIGDNTTGILDEVEVLRRKKDDIPEPYHIIAKSVGALIAMQATHMGVLHPQRAVFLGLPVALARSERIPVDEWVHSLKVPTLILQKEEDPKSSVEDIEHFIAGHMKDNITLKKIEGDDYDYTKFDLLKKEITNYFEK